MSNYIPESKQRLDATKRLDELAMGTMDRYINPVVLLSRALEETRVFLSAEVCGSIEIILDATLPVRQVHCG